MKKTRYVIALVLESEVWEGDDKGNGAWIHDANLDWNRVQNVEDRGRAEKLLTEAYCHLGDSM